MARVPFKQADLTRAIRSAEAAGWTRGSYKVVVDKGAISLLPIDAGADEGADLERRMAEMITGDDGAPALRP
jgi:hypothetical protein